MTQTAVTESFTSEVTAPPRTEPAWLDRARFPFAPRFIALEGHQLHYVDVGRGPHTFLFVHGTPSWSFEWRHAITALSHHGRCVALDHLGFGLSDKPAHAAYEPADHARRLRAFVRALDLRDVTLVVHDFGGPIGLSVALQEPARIRAIAALNTWAWSLADDPRVARIARVLASPLGRFLYLWLNASPRWLLPATFADRRRLDRDDHRHYLGPFARRQERHAPLALGLALAASADFYQALWHGLPQLNDRPWSLIWGERDPTFDVSALDRFRTALPRARIVRLPNTGHFPQEEQPEAVIQALLALTADQAACYAGAVSGRSV